MTDNLDTNQSGQNVLLSNSRAELLAGSVGAAFIAAIIWTESQSLAILGWLCVIQLAYGLRFFLTRKMLELDSDSQAEVISRIRVGLVAIGFLWGGVAAANMFLHGLTWPTIVTLISTVVLSILVLGTYLGHRALVIPFALSIALPIMAAGVLTLQRETIIVAVSSLVFMAAISAAAKYVDQMLKSFYVTSSERDKFYSMLKVSEQEIQKLKVGVKTNSEKRVALENELNDRNSELKLTKGKAQALSTALERVSPHDSESGLLNAKKFHNVLNREWSRMLRQELPLTIVHLSLDNFEGYIDTYGKIAKEAAIRKIGDLIRQTGTRPGDVAARIEEEKFAILLPEADHKNGERLADKLREQIRQLNMPNANSPMHSSVTASFGVATVIPNSDLTIDELLKRVDSALYEAQFQGGDKVTRYRTMNSVKLERWNPEFDGDFSPEGLLQKLAVWGYEAEARTLKPGEYHPDRRVQVDTVDAIVKGSLKVTLEGESQVLNVGDCLFLPKGVVTSIEVVSNNPVVCLEALRA